MKALYTLLSELGFAQWALIVLFLSIFIDVVPVIKVNPIKAIFNYIGKAFNSSIEKELGEFKSEINNKFEDLSKEQNLQRKTIDKLILEDIDKEINGYRWDIINFKNNISNGDKFSRDQYRHMIDIYDKYINIIDDKEINISDDHYIEVKECGDYIKEHYEIHKDDQDLLI